MPIPCSEANIVSFLLFIQVSVRPKSASAQALKSLHQFLIQWGINIIQYSNSTVGDYYLHNGQPGVNMLRDRQNSCRIANIVLIQPNTLYFIPFKNTMLWDQENSFIRCVIAQLEVLGPLLSKGS